jgi:hypothetical protein
VCIEPKKLRIFVRHSVCGDTLIDGFVPSGQRTIKALEKGEITTNCPHCVSIAIKLLGYKR